MSTEKFIEEMNKIQKKAYLVLGKYGIEKIQIEARSDEDGPPIGVFFMCCNKKNSATYCTALHEAALSIKDHMEALAAVKED